MMDESQNHAEKRIRLHLKRLFARPDVQLAPSDIVYLLIKSRELLENRSECHAIKFYASWILHTKLSNRGTVSRIHTDILKALDDFHNHEDGTVYHDAINKALHTDKLRSELQFLFKKHDLPTELFDYYKIWTGFFELMAPEFVGKAIDFSNVQMPKNPDDVKIVRLELIGHTDMPVQWHITFSVNNRSFDHYGSFSYTEHPDDFKPS